MEHSPILITGTHRSGTTWIGKTLDFSRSVEYLGEPFNPGKHNPYISYEFSRWFAHVPAMDQKEDIFNAFKEVFNKRASILNRYRRMIADHHGKPSVKHYLKFAGLALLQNRVLVKDPIALRSAGWLADNFDMNVICTIRHPLRFVSSLKQWNMEFDFNHLLNDGVLTDDRLQPYEDKIHYFAASRQDIISQACLLWNVLNHLIRHYKETRPEWYFIRFEDISKEPITYFRKLFEFVNLNCDTNIERKIKAHTLKSKRKNTVKSFSARNSKKNLDTWQERLNNKEVNKILVSCEDLTTYFYPEKQ